MFLFCLFLVSSVESRGSAKDTELDKDGDVLNHCAEGADEPGEVGEDVLFFLRVEDDLCEKGKRVRYVGPKHSTEEKQVRRNTYSRTIGSIAQQAEHEKEQRQALARFFALVLDDLGDTCAEVADCAGIA